MIVLHGGPHHVGTLADGRRGCVMCARVARDRRENQAAIELHAPPGRALRCDVCGLAMPSGGQGSSSSCARCGVGVRWRQRELL